jgi:DNA-binding NtrC family response regulator
MGERARILVVDDDESIRRVLATILELEGYNVDTVETGKQAIEKTDANFYNVVLIDIRLPDMEGTKLLTEMKETTPKMAKIIVTGFPSLQTAVEAVNQGADAYILKPVNMDNVLETITEQLQKQQKAQEYSEEKVAEFIETRVKEIENERMIVQDRKNP